MGGECQTETARQPRAEERDCWLRCRSTNRPGTLLVAAARCAVLRFPLLQNSWPKSRNLRTDLGALRAGPGRARRYGRNLRVWLGTRARKVRQVHVADRASWHVFRQRGWILGAAPHQAASQCSPCASLPRNRTPSPADALVDPPRDTPCRWCTLTLAASFPVRQVTGPGNRTESCQSRDEFVRNIEPDRRRCGKL